MDILDEIDETIKDKKGKWNYTPMREKSETDVLIDQLLKEFNSNTKPPYKTSSSDYNKKTEMEERQEYENFTSKQPESPEPIPEYQPSANDKTQIFSREDIEHELADEADADNNYSEYNGNGNYNDNNDDYDYDYDDNDYYDEDDENYNFSGGFDDDYYDETDFELDCENLPTENLDEDEYAEFEEFVDHQENDSIRIIKPKAKINMPKTIFRIFYTAVIAAFTIIGILSSAIFCLEKLQLAPSDIQEKEDALKEEMTSVLFPFVFTSIDDFEAAENISKEQIVNLSLWEIIIGLNGNLSVFEDKDTEKIIIPQSQVEYAAEKLLGEEIKVEACNIKFADLQIEYDEDKKGYIIPDNYNIYTFYPTVTNVKEKDDLYTVNVDCFSDIPKWEEKKKKTPAKKMVFTLKKTSEYYNIISAKTLK